MRALWSIVVLLAVLGGSSAKGAESEASQPSLLGPPGDLRIELGVEFARGVAGFAIDSPPYDSRLEFPVAGYHYILTLEIRPLTSLPDLSLVVEGGSIQPEIYGSTKDTDWVWGTKWLYSRSETEGTVFRFEGSLCWRLWRTPLVDVDALAGGFFCRDIYTMHDLRQLNLQPFLTSPPSIDYQSVPGEVARYEQRIAALSLALRARIPLGPWLDVRLAGAVLPAAWVEGFGNWKLRLYRFQQYGPSFFLSYTLRAEVALRLASWLSVAVGLRRVDWRAEEIGEDGQYASNTAANYENIGVVAYVRHVQYGFTLAVSVLL